MFTITDPAVNAAVASAVIDEYTGVLITLTTTGNAQTLQSPSDVAVIVQFVVVNNDTSTDSVTVNGITLAAGDSQMFCWDGSAWAAVANVYATTTSAGVIELATAEEAVTGTDALRAITPSTLTSRLAAPGTIGGTTPAEGNFTTVNGTTFDTNVAAAGVTLSGTTLAADGTDADIDINITPKGTGEVNISKADIDAGTIDGTVIGGSSAAAGKFTSLEAQTAKVTGGTPGVGKILTSDAVGNASWENAPSGTVPDSGTTANLPLVSDGAHGYSIASRDIRDIANLARVPNQGVAMTSATSGSNGITVADNDNIDFGTGNYTLVWKGSIPDWTPSSAVVLIQKTDGTNGWILQVATSGVLQLVRNAEAAKSSTAAPSITDGTTHEIVCVVTTETASVAGSVVFYVDGVQLGDTVTITAGSPTTVSNSTALYVVGTSSTRSASTTYHAYTFNRALTAAEVLDLYRNGISYADQWGSQTALTSGTLTTGKKYRINTYVSDDDFTNIGAASNASGVEFTATGTTPTHWAHSSSLVEIGATLALEPEGINETNWQDSSTNNLDATYPTTGWSLTRKVPTSGGDFLVMQVFS